MRGKRRSRGKGSKGSNKKQKMKRKRERIGRMMMAKDKKSTNRLKMFRNMSDKKMNKMDKDNLLVEESMMENNIRM